MHVPMEDRALYDMPSRGAKPGKSYRIDFDLPQTSGGVAETTGSPTELDVTTGTPVGAKVFREEFKIGKRDLRTARFRATLWARSRFRRAVQTDLRREL